MKRPWLLPLSPLWAMGSAWKSRAFDRDASRAHALQRPVVSVGSLSAGGAGKTPFVIALGKALQRSGVAVDVLSRGYGRSDATEARRVDENDDALTAGDEPLLIARALNAPVYVASQRIQAGLMAEADPDNHSAVHLLDDGFQHRQLARAVDIVLLTAQDVHDTLLPAGDLREPLRSLRRASILAVRNEEADAIQPVLKRLFAQHIMPPVWTIARHFNVTEGAPTKRPLAFCGLARPDSFHTALHAYGTTPADFLALRDHVRYTDAVIERLLASAARANADGFVTTAKDAVKLTTAMRERLQRVGPLAVADVDVQLYDEPHCVQTLLRMLHTRSSA